MRIQSSFFGKLDRTVLICYVLLLCFGWVNIYAASNPDLMGYGWDWSNEAGRQLVFIGMGCLLILLILLSDARIYPLLSTLIYAFSILLLIAVLIWGVEVGGNKSWLNIGGIGLQPAEFAKLGTAIMLANLMGQRDANLTTWSARIKPLAVVLLPMALVLAQPDAGSALVFTAFLMALYIEGLPGYLMYMGIGSLVLGVLALAFPINQVIIGIIAVATLAMLWSHAKKRLKGMQWLKHPAIASTMLAVVFALGVQTAFDNVLKPHQQIRIKLLLGQVDDSGAVGYQTAQSLIAIGSGGWTGQGFNQGSQTKLKFVPEQSTDYIFTTVGEEWGFIGAMLLLLTYTILIARMVVLAARQKQTFARVFGMCIASILLVHYVVNIGMTLGLMPVIGIPLPLFSYGGSSLWAFTLMIFIFLRLDAFRWQTLS